MRKEEYGILGFYYGKDLTNEIIFQEGYKEEGEVRTTTYKVEKNTYTEEEIIEAIDNSKTFIFENATYIDEGIFEVESYKIEEPDNENV